MRPSGRGGGSSSFSGDNIYTEFFGSGIGSSGAGKIPVFQSDGDVFYGFREALKAPPVERKLLCSLEELYSGSTKKMKISRTVVSCHGRRVQEQEDLNIVIKAGWKKGTKITFSEKGNEQPDQLPADLVFIIDEKPHDTFTRDGNDLIINQRISLGDALGGTTLNITALDGRNLSIPVHDIITPGYEIVVTREGMPISKEPGKRGVLRIKFEVKFPTRLAPELRARLKRDLAA